MERISYSGSYANTQAQGRSDMVDEITSVLGKYKPNEIEVSNLADHLKSNYSTFDHKYVSALLFPEDSEPARIPTKFPLATALCT